MPPSESELLLDTDRFRIVEITYEGETGSRRRAVIRHPGAVTVAPLFEDGRVCLIKNYRPAVDQTLIELPAGTLNPGETPQQTARRELAEETGLRADRWKEVGSFFLSPGILDENMHLFAASGLTHGAPAREPDERIENLIVPWSDALAMIDDGRIHDAKTIAGLLLCDRWRRRIAAGGE